MQTNRRLLEEVWHEPRESQRHSSWEVLRQGAQLFVMLIGGVIGIVLLWPIFEKGEELKREVAHKDQVILEATRERDALADEYQALLTIPRAVEREARDRLNMARKGETIFRFAPYESGSMSRPSQMR